MTFRVNKTKDYTVMSNHHLREKNMSLKAKGLLSWMLSNDDSWNYSIAGIVACCKENETAIESAIEELKQFGYLTVTKLMPNETESGRIEYVYDVHEIPQKQEKQEVGFLPLEIQPIENHPQRNTKERNTKEENNTILKNSTAEPSESNSDELPKRVSKRKLFMNDDFSEKEDKQVTTKTENKKMNLYQKCLLEIDAFTDDENLKNALKEYLSIRLKIQGEKRLLGVGQWKGMLRILGGLKGDKVAIVNRSIERGWASFFELNDYKYKNVANNNNKDKFAEGHGVKSVRPEDVEGGQFSGQIF